MVKRLNMLTTFTDRVIDLHPSANRIFTVRRKLYNKMSMININLNKPINRNGISSIVYLIIGTLMKMTRNRTIMT